MSAAGVTAIASETRRKLLDALRGREHKVTAFIAKISSTGLPSEPIVLKMVKALPDRRTDVDLHWTGSRPPYDLYRSETKTAITDASSLLSRGVMTPHHLTGQVEPRLFYSIEPE